MNVEIDQNANSSYNCESSSKESLGSAHTIQVESDWYSISILLFDLRKQDVSYGLHNY